MPKLRWLPDVIDQIVPWIPKEEFEELLENLQSIHSSASYAAPEMSYHWWKEFSICLSEHLQEPDTEWKKEIVKILLNGEAQE